MIRAHWYKSKNVGDTLTPVILEHFLGELVEFAERNEKGKVLGVGSIMKALRRGDTVWGTGIMRETDTFPMAKDCRFLAVRGKLTRDILLKDGAKVPEVYGDPALLLPLMYKSVIRKEYKLGFIPHYVDKPLFSVPDNAILSAISGRIRVIDVEAPWREVVDAICSCERIVSSSLHGIIIAEAYGIPAKWEVYSDKVIGNGFKFRDYLTGTGREIQDPGWFPPIPDLLNIQRGLLGTLDIIK
jgi:pyruvyltransferase